MSDHLPEWPVTHGHVKPVLHDRLGVTVNGQSVVRYMRFLREVCIDRLELARIVGSRWVPDVPDHPAHLTVSTLNHGTGLWEEIRDVELPPDPRIRGEGLSQDMSIEEMNAHFARVMQEPPQVIDLGGVLTDHLRVECDREHPVWPNHGETNGGIHNVPFETLNTLRAYGDTAAGGLRKIAYNPLLKKGRIRPSAPQGMEVIDLPDMLLFRGARLSVGFSLHRPMLMHLGWDALGEDHAARNRVMVARGSALFEQAGGPSGPLLRTLDSDYGAHLWTGEVEVDGNRVMYRNLHCIDGLTIDAVFTIEAERLTMQLTQTCSADIPVIEADAWRFLWNLRAGMTAAAAMPTLVPGRNGDVHLPAVWATDRAGCLSCRLADGVSGESRLQVESFRLKECTTAGFQLGPRPHACSCMLLPAGVRQAIFVMYATNLEPDGDTSRLPSTSGVHRHWAGVFSCFRPELGGFSNNAASINCHLAQCPPLEVVTRTRRPESGPDPIDLAGFTIGRAILDGGGYGYWRNLYMDSDPMLLSSAGRIHQVRPDEGWLRHIEPGLLEMAERMLATIGETGLVHCSDLTGNTDSFRWSTNGMDVVGFGHLDAYVNAWSYRAFRNAAALLADLGHVRFSDRCREAAAGIRAAYAPHLVNPKTGWVAGWRSLDGELHDYAFTYVNGAALAFGLLDPQAAERALRGLEQLRDEVGSGSACLGIPANLWPIRPGDHMLPKLLGEIQPTFEMYTDGSMSSQFATYYMRALSIHGLKDRARKLAEEMDRGFATGMFGGGMGTGREFLSWEGCPTGYEGTLIGCMSPVYSIAIEFGVLTPTEPEWWPVNG